MSKSCVQSKRFYRNCLHASAYERSSICIINSALDGSKYLQFQL